MKNRTSIIRKRILAIAVMTALILMQSAFLMSLREDINSYADDCSLEVRVQYEGWRGDKIPVKKTFSSSELLAIGSSTYKYTNLTDVATVMRIVAKGPKLTSVLDAAGIDRKSIKYIVFRTTDGSGQDGRYAAKTMPTQYENLRYYYPNLANNYERDSDSGIIKPNKGALADPVKVPAIIGVRYYSTKNGNDSIDSSRMESKSFLRLCLGQTKITEDKWTKSGYSGDVTSEESIENIYGVDVILQGSPVKGMKLGLNGDTKLGSTVKITVSINGDQAFVDEYAAENLQWSSSDESVATVDERGTVSIVGDGVTTITAVTDDGMKSSIVIDTAAAPEKKQVNKAKQLKSVNKKSVITDSVAARELMLGDKIIASDNKQAEMMANTDTTALGEAEDYSKGALVGTIGTVIAACGAGFVIRLRRFRMDK